MCCQYQLPMIFNGESCTFKANSISCIQYQLPHTSSILISILASQDQLPNSQTHTHNDTTNTVLKFYEVRCDCEYAFCWKCAEEDAHSPLDCETVGKWVLKNTAEAENTTWILAYTKPCPQCKKSIEKNAGCMHMSCRCGHQFCWLCLGPWSRHDGTACNRFREVGKVSKREQQRELAKKSIERYTHYYERWAANEKSRKQALSDLHMNQTRIQALCMDDGQKVNALQFIIKAWLQIVDCRRVLKWTYAYWILHTRRRSS